MTFTPSTSSWWHTLHFEWYCDWICWFWMKLSRFKFHLAPTFSAFAFSRWHPGLRKRKYYLLDSACFFPLEITNFIVFPEGCHENRFLDSFWGGTPLDNTLASRAPWSIFTRPKMKMTWRGKRLGDVGTIRRNIAAELTNVCKGNQIMKKKCFQRCNGRILSWTSLRSMWPSMHNPVVISRSGTCN